MATDPRLATMHAHEHHSGELTASNAAFRFQNAAAHTGIPVPDLGADGLALLRDLGCSDAAIDALRRVGALHLDGAAAH